MAKRKLSPDKTNKYLSLAYPESIDIFSDSRTRNNTESDTESRDNKGVNIVGENQRRLDSERASSLNGAGSSKNPLPEVTPKSNITPGYSGNNTPNATSNIVEPTFARPAFQPNPMGDTPQSSLPNFMQQENGALPPVGFGLSENFSRMNTNLFGNADLKNVARSVLSESNNRPATNIELTPEEELLSTLAKTNPTPSGLWKRLLVGVARGASQITPGEPIANSFGKILGNVVARSIPQVDSGLQYEESKARAIEDYKLKRATADAKAQRNKVNQDVLNDQERIRQNEAARQRQIRIDAEARIERLEDNKRADAKLKLEALQNMSEDDSKREAAAKELEEKYGINVGASYGIKEKSSSSAGESELRRRAEADVTKELGATTKERARGATANTLQQELREQMPPDLYAALTDTNASAFKKAQAIKMRNEIEDRANKRNVDYTESDYERRVTERMDQLRNEKPAKRANSAKPATSNKVAPSSSAGKTDFRTIKFK